MPITTTALTETDSIPYSVEFDLADEMDQTSNSVSVTVAIADSDCKRFKSAMLGWSEIDKDTGGLIRYLPEPCKWDQANELYCVKLEPLGKTPLYSTGTLQLNDAGWPKFDIARYRATFARPLYQVKSDAEVSNEQERFCVWMKKVTSINEKIPGGGFRFVDDTKPANTQVQLPEVGVKVGRQLMLSCKWVDVPRVDYDTLAFYCNKINDGSFEMDGTIYDTGTVLLSGIDTQPRINSRGDKSYDITFEFAIRADGRSWNRFWKSGKEGYVEVSDNGLSTGNKPFDSLVFDLLWSFA
jgi:hypothetical protein